MTLDEIKVKLKKVILEGLELEGMEEKTYEDILFDPSGYGLDSVDAVELAVIIKRNFGVELTEEDSEAFTNIETLAQRIFERLNG